MGATWTTALAVLAAAAWAAGCESTAPSAEPPPAPPPAAPETPLDRFSAARAWADLAALAAIGPRVAGSEGAAEARRYIARQLGAVAPDVREIETVRLRAEDGASEAAEAPHHEILTHVVATLPGASPDRFVLVAPYDSSEIEGIDFVGVNDGASGAALLVELGRVLSTRSLPYTVQLVFLEGEGRAPGGEGPARWSGSRSLAEQMEQQGALEGVRMLVAFNQVCDADLQIARDLGSHRMHREEFFRAARRLGRPDGFPRDLGFETVDASHDAFRDRGVRGALALVDTRFGGDQVPGLYADSLDDSLEHCAPRSLEDVGVVTLAALETIGRRLAKIDRFSRAPLSPVEPGPRPSGGSPEPAPLTQPEPPEADEPAAVPTPPTTPGAAGER